MDDYDTTPAFNATAGVHLAPGQFGGPHPQIYGAPGPSEHPVEKWRYIADRLHGVHQTYKAQTHGAGSLALHEAQMTQMNTPSFGSES